MADVLKAQKVKLANSRKRFKELQEKKRLRNVPEKPAVSPAISDDVTSLDNSNSPTHDFLNDERVHETPPFTSFASLPEPCDNVTNQDNHQQSSFFDHFVPNVTAQPNQNQPDDKSTAFTLSQGSLCDDITNLSNTEASQHVLHLDGPSSISSHFADPLTNPQRPDNMSNSGNLTDIPYREKGEIYNSSIESLQQLSNQINEFVNPEYCTSNSITDLEKRNVELATQLEHERIVSGKQNALINDLRTNIDELQRELREKVETCNTNMGYEVNKLREELQCHIQTIGMLVAEKTELSANLSQLELCSKQKSGECEELKARLKASRSRVADLEKEIGNLKLEKSQNETMIREQAQAVERLRDECSKFREQKNDDMQEILEVREKLKNSSEENILLQQQIKELSSKVSLADIKIQQINNGEQTEGQLEKLMQEKFELEKQLRDASQFLRTLTKERDESSVQYQQYVQQQNVQLISISNKMEQLQAENERLSKQDQARIKHINELEKQIQALQSDQVKYAVNKMNGLELKEDSDEAKNEKGVSEEDYVKVVNEKEMLLKELEAKSGLISEMESLVEQLQGSQSDSAKLLATIESDKVAAAIAVQQNRDLKLQLEGIQEVFLKLVRKYRIS
ncbi:hypothetical protein NQ318_014210 [Aromia moschata]|uniref:Golgin subfamily A conserved domain-containing protein n=1 Tax=Aromia moschata TaxID=1265417 RepID=A0AAV8Z0F6_9CUCU|nr:hypothetical protein NQ318_014210 [Aromia moschata]